MVNKNILFNNIYKDKKVLITGNTGFKGSWLTLWLLKLGAKVYGISNDIPTKPSVFEELKLEQLIQFHREDVRNLDFLKSFISDIKPDFVFHLAAQAIVSLSYENPIETITTNIIGTANILEALRYSNHTCTAIIVTSDKCYDNVEWVWGYKESDNLGGKDIYSGSKGAAELTFKSYYHSFFKSKDSNVSLASVRAGNVIGGGDWATQRIVPDCMRSWSENKTVVIRSPDSTRPWQHVLEPLSGYLNLGCELYENRALNGESFNFGPKSDVSVTVRALIEDLSGNWKLKGVEPYEFIDNKSFHEAGLLKLNCDKALFYLNWMATLDYDKLIEFTSLWYHTYYNAKQDIYSLTISQITEYEELAKTQGIKWAIQK
jgi:CDP-glucose 4,6-dehydratase